MKTIDNNTYLQAMALFVTARLRSLEAERFADGLHRLLGITKNEAIAGSRFMDEIFGGQSTAETVAQAFEDALAREGFEWTP